jgi:branched-chain amino acid aminotransferase
MNYYNQNTIIYHNGNLVKAADVAIDLYSQTMHYGFGVFEGIRSYKTTTGNTKIFKAQEHYQRLQHSANSLHLPYTYSVEALTEATYTILAANNLQDAYIRPLVYAPANMSFNKNTESNIAILAWKMQPFLGTQLLRVKASTYQRPNPKGFILTAKACGHYVNSILASYDAKANGFDEALLLDIDGFAAEAPGANLFVEKNGKLLTPQLGNILPGITRATVIELAKQLQIEVTETQININEIYNADAAFFCGTAAEVIGFESLDNIGFTKTWEETLSYKIQQAYKALVVKD